MSSLPSRPPGYGVRLVEATGRYARLALRLPGSGDELQMDLLKEALEPRWVTVQLAPAASVRALSLDDTVGLKACAWVTGWYDDLARRLAAERTDDELPDDL